MNKEIKLFLSSTFNEMQEQRDYFRNEIIAEINHIVGQIGVNLYLYDFELGINKGTAFTDVLDICFKKIDESEYFVAIIENDYGTHIKKAFEDKQESYSSKEYEKLVTRGIQEDLSVLELESIKALDNPKQKKLFFIKDVSNRSAKIQKLQIRVQASADSNVKIFHYTEPKNILVELKQYFSEEIKSKIEKYPTDEQKNRNLAYANKTRYFVSNDSTQEIFNELDSYVNNDSRKIFVLSSIAGSGKRTTLLQWIQKQEENTKIISAFAGIDGNNITDIMLRIYQDSTDEKSSIRKEEIDEKSLLGRFAQFTLDISLKFQKTIILIDGINQLEFTSEWKNKYWWLNRQLEHNVKVVVSTTEEVNDTHFEIHSMPSQNLPELIEHYLHKEGKEQIFENFQARLIFNDENSIPAFARLLCTEICMVAKFDTINEILDGDIKSVNILELYKKFLQRLEERSSLNNNTVQDICRYLYFSENGLNIEILKHILNDRKKQVDSFNFLLYHELIRDIDDRVNFSTFYFEQAVKEKYIDICNEKEYRTAIIKALEDNRDEKKKENLAERAYQIYQINDKQKMHELLSNLENAEELYNMNRICFLRHLELIEDKNKKTLFDNCNNEEHLPFLAEYYQSIAEFEKAKQFHTILQDKSESEFGKNHTNTATIYNNIGEVYYLQGIYDSALKYHKKALEISEKVLGREHLDTIATYNNIALVYDAQGDYNRALKYNKKALDVSEKKLGKEHPDTGTSYNNIADVYRALGDYELALEYNQKALEISEKILGEEHLDTATTNNNMGEVYRVLGDYDRALICNKKALDIYEKIWGKNHPDTASAYDNRAGIYYELGKYNDALKYYKKSLIISEKFLGKNHSDTATTYNNMSEVYRALGKYELALEYLRKALEIYESKPGGKEHPDTATTHNNMGIVYYAQGNYDHAFEHLWKALEIREKILGKKHPDTATTYNNIGLVYEVQGNYDKALEYYKKDLGVTEKIFGKEHPDTATTYHNMGLVYDAQEDYDNALKYYNKALTIKEKLLGNEHPSTATTYNNIGVVYCKQKKFDLSLGYLSKALTINEKLLGSEHPETAATYRNMAAVYNFQGNYKTALKLYKQALIFFEKTQRDSLCELYEDIAKIFEKTGDNAEALLWYKKSLSIKDE